MTENKGWPTGESAHEAAYTSHAGEPPEQPAVLPANPGRMGNWRCPTCNAAPLAKLDEANTRLQCTVCGQPCTRPEGI